MMTRPETQDEVRRMLLLSNVIELWDRGMDTDQIARTLARQQEEIERALHEALEERRRQKALEDDTDDADDDPPGVA
jgi:hypothetical protein